MGRRREGKRRRRSETKKERPEEPEGEGAGNGELCMIGLGREATVAAHRFRQKTCQLYRCYGDPSILLVQVITTTTTTRPHTIRTSTTVSG